MTNEMTIKIAKDFCVNPIFARYLYRAIDKNYKTENIARLIQERPKPFIKWVGGKRQLLKQFYELGLYPPSIFDSENKHYFEPFVGGGAVFFDLLPKNATLSDMNNELIITYKVIRDDVDLLIALLKKHVYDKSYYLNIRAQKIVDLSELEIASRFIYLNRTCFNGMYRVNSRGEFNVPFGKYSNPVICDECNLKKASKALQGIEIIQQDYKAVLKDANKGDFVYFDPPYYPISKTASFTSYTKDGFLEKEQIELRDTYVELHNRGCYVMLSNSDTGFIKSIYGGIKGVHISKVLAKRNINSNAARRGKVNEILVTNYKNEL